jgi:ADP-heptose:LPS heptosyltransferase
MNPNDLGRFGTVPVYVSGQANLYPQKKIRQLRKLIDTKSPKVCVYRGPGMGDILMTTPTVRALKTLFPEPAHITYATNTRYIDGGLAKLLKYNPYVDEVIDQDQLDESNYDLVVNLHCPCIGYERAGCVPKNRIDLFAEHAGVKLENKQVDYFIQDKEINQGKEFLSQNKIRQDSKKIMVHIFTTASRRNLDMHTFKNALMELSKDNQLIVLSHSTDYGSDIYFDNIPNSCILKDADIREVAGVMANCDLVLCPDSSILHLAGALSIPTVSLFGHTDPNARINYYPNTVAIWPGNNMQCSPCWSGQCNMKNICYKMIETNTIVNTCNMVINKKRTVSLPSGNTIQIERI